MCLPLDSKTRIASTALGASGFLYIVKYAFVLCFAFSVEPPLFVFLVRPIATPFNTKGSIHLNLISWTRESRAQSTELCD